jgi:hypothetical protein
MSSSPLLILTIVGTTALITIILLWGIRRALLAAGRSSADVRRIVSTFGSVLFGWFAIALSLGLLGVFGPARGPIPYIALAISVPIVVGALLLRGSKQVREILGATPQSWLVGFQFFRVVGATFLVLYAAGRLPGIFAIPAGAGDVFVGLAALFVAASYAQRREKSDWLVQLWNWVGISDLVIAVATGFLSSPSPFQIFSLDAPNILIGSFPLVMIPIYAVPIAIVLHLASLMKLRQERRARYGCDVTGQTPEHVHP